MPYEMDEAVGFVREDLEGEGGRECARGGEVEQVGEVGLGGRRGRRGSGGGHDGACGPSLLLEGLVRVVWVDEGGGGGIISRWAGKELDQRTLGGGTAGTLPGATGVNIRGLRRGSWADPLARHRGRTADRRAEAEEEEQGTDMS